MVPRNDLRTIWYVFKTIYEYLGMPIEAVDSNIVCPVCYAEFKQYDSFLEHQNIHKKKELSRIRYVAESAIKIRYFHTWSDEQKHDYILGIWNKTKGLK